jgi:hypothetical protein
MTPNRQTATRVDRRSACSGVVMSHRVGNFRDGRVSSVPGVPRPASTRGKKKDQEGHSLRLVSPLSPDDGRRRGASRALPVALRAEVRLQHVAALLRAKHGLEGVGEAPMWPFGTQAGPALALPTLAPDAGPYKRIIRALDTPAASVWRPCNGWNTAWPDTAASRTHIGRSGIRCGLTALSPQQRLAPDA